MRSFTNAVLLVGLGFAVYYVGPIAHEALRGQAKPQELEVAPVLANSPKESAGNAYLYQSLMALERHRSLAVEAAQTGFIEGREVTSSGYYMQSGQGEKRLFTLRLDGTVANDPVRLLQVCNPKRMLWTDLAWGEAANISLRRVWKVDLGRIQQSLAKEKDKPLSPGEAAADSLDPGMWASLGGLPMLLESLQTNFDFAQPRRMMLLTVNEPVYAMVGFWKPEQRRRLLMNKEAEGAVSEDSPNRLPHHVLVAIGARDLFPYRVEYRGANDPLSQASLPSDSRYGESTQPLLKLEFQRPRFNVEIPTDKFDYKPQPDVNWMDRTAERLEMLKTRQQVALAQSQAPVAK